MAKPPVPNMPDRRPISIVEPKLPLGPSLSPSQADEFERASAGMHRCIDALRLLDQEPDGGDPIRREAILAESKEHTATLGRLTQLLTVKLNVATEAELASMNRAQRRIYEASMRKNKKAKGRS
jgi:hypothetical protein